jgi:hypothetical protein
VRADGEDADVRHALVPQVAPGAAREEHEGE